MEMASYAMVARFKGIDNFYRGPANKPAIKPLDPPGILALCEECCLWYFLFLKRSNMAINGFNYQHYEGHCKKFLGFLDFDYEEVDFSKLTTGEICQLFHDTLYEDLEHHFRGDWFAFYSGSKGFHVYICQPRFMVETPNMNRLTHGAMVETLKELLKPSDLFDKVDKSIYAPNKGIRPFTQRNPKATQWTPELYFASPQSRWNLPASRIELELFEWLSETLDMPGSTQQLIFPIVIDPPAPAQQQQQQQFASEALVSTEFQATRDEKIRVIAEFIRNAKGLQYLPVVDRQDLNQNIYFAHAESWCFCCTEEEAPTKHKRVKCWWRVFSGHAEQHCLAQRHKSRKFVLRFFERAAQQAPALCEFVAPFSEGQLIRVNPEEQFLSPQLIRENLEPDGSRLLVCSPMGTGKTYCLNKVIQESDWAKILVIGTRQTQCSVYKGAFAGSELYLDVQQDRPLHEIPFLVVCLNSLMKVLKPGMVVPQYDLLVVDECMTVLDALVSPLLSGAGTNQPGIFRLFKLLLRSAKRVIMMDGLPTIQLYKFLADKDLNIWHQFKVIQHRRQAEGKQFFFLDNPKRMEQLLLDELTSGGSVVLVSDSKMVLKHYHQLIPEDIRNAGQAATICGDTPLEIKKTATDPGQNWKSLRYLGYNTALGRKSSFLFFFSSSLVTNSTFEKSWRFI